MQAGNEQHEGAIKGDLHLLTSAHSAPQWGTPAGHFIFTGQAQLGGHKTGTHGALQGISRCTLQGTQSLQLTAPDSTSHMGGVCLCRTPCLQHPQAPADPQSSTQSARHRSALPSSGRDSAAPRQAYWAALHAPAACKVLALAWTWLFRHLFSHHDRRQLLRCRLPTPCLDELQRPLHYSSCCHRIDKLLRQRLLQPNPLPGPLLQEGGSCGLSCGPTSASKPGVQAHFMCEQLAHRVRQLSLEKQVCPCCLAAPSCVDRVPRVPVHVWLPEARKTSLATESPGSACLCNRSICMAHLLKRAQEQGTAVVLGLEECWSCYLPPPSKAEQPATKLLL